VADDMTPGCAVVQRHLDDEHEAIIARVDLREMASAYEDHARLWDLAPDPLDAVMMRQFLAAACLYLSSRPTDEDVAWTLNLATPPLNLFVSGSTARNAVTGRLYRESVRDVDQSVLYVDTRRSQGSDRRSVVEVEGLDLLLIFEQFAQRSDQALQRFFELDEHDFLMVASLPTDRRGWISELDRAGALAAFEQARPLDEREFWWQCGCTKERIVQVIGSAFLGAGEATVRADETLDVTCPRCGRHWSVGMADLDEAQRRMTGEEPPESD
jgi:hypothetical protein